MGYYAGVQYDELILTEQMLNKAMSKWIIYIFFLQFELISSQIRKNEWVFKIQM